MSDFRLKAFISVAKNLSFTKASKELYISQPAITRHIQELEAKYHIALFERMGNKIKLTRAGEILLEHSERIVEDYKRLEYDLHLLTNTYAGELRIGASTTIAQYVLPAVLAKFVDKFPDVKISLLNSNSRQIESALGEHRIDLGMVEGIQHTPNIKYTVFMQDELVAVVSNRSKLSRRDEISLCELPHIPLVLREQGSGTLDVLEAALLPYSIKLSCLNVQMFLGSTESIKRYLEHSDCMGIVSFRAIQQEVLEGKLKIIDFKECRIERNFSFIQQYGQDTGLAAAFIQFAMHYNKEI